MCLFFSSTKPVITLLGSAAVISMKKKSQHPSSKKEKLHMKTTTLKTLTLKIYIYWSLLHLVKLITITVPLALSLSLNGKVNISSCFYTGQRLLYNNTTFSSGIPTCSTNFSVGFVCSHVLLSSSEARARPGRETKYCSSLIHTSSCDMIRNTSKWY